MTKEELDKIPRKDAQHLLAEEYPLMAVEMELNHEWWRGYHAAKALWVEAAPADAG